MKYLMYVFFSRKLYRKLNWVEKRCMSDVLWFSFDILHTGRSQIGTDLWCQMWFLFCPFSPAWACQRVRQAHPQEAVKQALIRCMAFIIQNAQPMKWSWQVSFPYPPSIPQPSHTWCFPPECWSWCYIRLLGLASLVTALGAGRDDSTPDIDTCTCVNSHHPHPIFSNKYSLYWTIGATMGGLL